MNVYEVIVRNIGIVHCGNCKHKALNIYLEYVSLSRSGIGRAGFEEVSLFCDGDEIESLVYHSEYR